MDLPHGTGVMASTVRIAPLGSRLVLVLVEDRTEARRVDEVRRDFVANVSHELKTPVGALALLAEAVQAASDDPEAVRRFAARMQQESHRLTSLIQDLIDLSRVQIDAPLAASAEKVHVAEVVADALDRSYETAAARRIELVADAEDDVAVRGDRTQLSAALGNLVENAVNYSPDDTRVAVTVKPVGDLVEISVTDQGIGIPERDLERIFERFYRVDPARSRATGGTGLGLSIVKHIAATHGGEVTVWSSEGNGSTFTLKLPVCVEERDLAPAV
jgi:two-component system sensor histidine kinase SenX3